MTKWIVLFSLALVLNASADTNNPWRVNSDTNKNEIVGPLWFDIDGGTNTSPFTNEMVGIYWKVGLSAPLHPTSAVQQYTIICTYTGDIPFVYICTTNGAFGGATNWARESFATGNWP